MKKLTLLRSGNWVTVSPCPPEVRDVLVPRLTFTEREYKQGMDRGRARRDRTPLAEEHLVECFVDDHKGRVTFPFGFVEPLSVALGKVGYAVTTRNLTPPANPQIFEPHWDRVYDGDTELLYRQDEFLVKVAAHENGLFDCPTGWGKSFLIGMIARMWPRARIAILSKSVTVVHERIYPELCQMVPDVGIVFGQKKKRGRRVMCYTVDSMRWLLKDCEEYGNYDVVIFDEVHLAAADNCAFMLAQVPGQPRMYGFSATQDMREDGKDYRVRALFGPIRMKVTYDEAMRAGVIVPMEVIVRKVVMDINPCAGRVDEDKMRHGVWSNDYRNDLVLGDAIGYAAKGMQTMISCQFLEHVLRIKKRFDRLRKRGKVPDNVELVCLYRQHDNRQEWNKVLRDMTTKGVGDVFAKLPFMSYQRRVRLTKRIEAGKVKLFVGTTILNVGFDPKDMRVVSRADCTSSKIADTQVPGRNARHADDKYKGIVREYWDKFDTGLSLKYKKREKSYKRLKWKIKIVTSKSPLRNKMKWE